MKIIVVGTGCVGISSPVLLARNHDVIAVDNDESKVAAIKARRSPIEYSDIDDYLTDRSLKLSASADLSASVAGADFVVVAALTDYDVETGKFDTSTVEAVIWTVRTVSPQSTIVIKATVPVGFTRAAQTAFATELINFSPEFLREGRAPHENLHPSRIIVGDAIANGKTFAELLVEGAIDEDPSMLLTEASEAEAIKLFANTYLAHRVTYSKELDTSAGTHGVNSRKILEGASLDDRTGDQYNNPSFGLGGYCLSKSTKQLLAKIAEAPQNIVPADVQANSTRRGFIASDIMRRNLTTVANYRLTMKCGSKDFRSSSMHELMKRVTAKGVEAIVHQPILSESSYHHSDVIKDFDELQFEDTIDTNRIVEVLDAFANKVYSRDMIGRAKHDVAHP